MSKIFSPPKMAAPPPTPTPNAGKSAAEIATETARERRIKANRTGRRDSLLGGDTGGTVSMKRLLGK